jgi:hypothetical protein
MTDLIERVEAAFPRATTSAHDGATTEPRDLGTRPVGRAVPILLAMSLGASAVLLFAMSSGHLSGAKAAVGVVAAVIDVIGAVAVVVRPSRPLLVVLAAANAAVMGFWIAAHGPHGVSTTTAAVGVALAVVSVAVACTLAVRPRAGERLASSTAVFGSVVPVGIAVVTVVALFATPAASAPTTSAPSSPTSAGARAAQEALSSTIRVPGESSKTFQSIVAGNDTEQAELKKWVPLDPHDQAILTAQLSQALQAAERYPTVASAKQAHMILAGGMAPGVGAHYQSIGAELFKGINPDGSVNALYPASWIYASTANNAPVVGVMYESLSDKVPSGFIGPNDHWHRHSNVCVQFKGGQIAVPFAADQNITPQECADVHGTFMKKTVWMVHAWVVPGWESPQGVFSHDNLHLYCPGNTDLTNAIGFCDRQS